MVKKSLFLVLFSFLGLAGMDPRLAYLNAADNSITSSSSDLDSASDLSSSSSSIVDLRAIKEEEEVSKRPTCLSIDVNLIRISTLTTEISDLNRFIQTISNSPQLGHPEMQAELKKAKRELKQKQEELETKELEYQSQLVINKKKQEELNKAYDITANLKAMEEESELNVESETLLECRRLYKEVERKRSQSLASPAAKNRLGRKTASFRDLLKGGPPSPREKSPRGQKSPRGPKSPRNLFGLLRKN